MRLNDPQIELVHDDPFMGYIETSTSNSVRADDPAPATARIVADDDDEDVDVGENSRPPHSRSSVSVSNSTEPVAGTDQSIVIVLLVE